MEMHRVPEKLSRKEVCGDAQRGGAHAARYDNPYPQTARLAGAEGAILLKTDAPEAGEAWSDGQIAAALDTSVDTVAGTRQLLVEEGFEAVLIRKQSPASARPRIFDGAADAKLIALACSEPPKRHARWTLKLLKTSFSLPVDARRADLGHGLLAYGLVWACNPESLNKKRFRPMRYECWISGAAFREGYRARERPNPTNPGAVPDLISCAPGRACPGT